METPEAIHRDLTFLKIKRIHNELHDALKESHLKEPKNVSERLNLIHSYNQKVILLITHA